MTPPDGGRVRIRETQPLYRGWVSLTRYAFDFRRRDGTWQPLAREIEDHGNSVAVLPHDADRDTVLLVRQFRLAAHLNGGDGMLVEACAGMIDDGETPAAAARREAREELGVPARRASPPGRRLSQPRVSTERMAMFIAPYTPSDRVARGGGAATRARTSRWSR